MKVTKNSEAPVFRETVEKLSTNYRYASDMQAKRGHNHSNECIPIIGSNKPNNCGLVKDVTPEAPVFRVFLCINQNIIV